MRAGLSLLFLQIPEVRLNIISNLDCVNQGTTVLLKNITGSGNMKPVVSGL